MKLGFEETQTPYVSGSQSARAWTQKWVGDWLYCPNCGEPKLKQYPANRPVADFHCGSCAEEYELKSQKTAFGNKVLDGAYRTMCDRLAAYNNPSLILLRYDRTRLELTDVCVVPKHFFVSDIIEERKPLSSTARRSGWIGCNSILKDIPEVGKIYFVRNGVAEPREDVVARWRSTVFLREGGLTARGWLIDVLRCVEAIGKPEFDLHEVYAFEDGLGRLYPKNMNIRPKIRQQLQVLREAGILSFLGTGRYRLQVR